MVYKRKVAKEDFTIDKLPSNRKELFFDLLKNRFWTFFKIGLVLALFMLPLILSSLVKEISIYNVYKSFSDNLITEEELKGHLISITLGYDLVNILLFILLAIGVSGIARIYKMLIWNEGVIFVSDFINGIKQNFKQYALLFFLTGILVLFNNFMMLMLRGTEFDYISYLPWSVTIVALFPIGLFCFSQIMYYTNTFKENFSNGIRLYISNPFKTLSIILLFLLPALLIIINEYIFVKFISLLIWTILILPIIICLWILYSNSLFDRSINLKFYPEIVNKGLYIKDTTIDKE